MASSKSPMTRVPAKENEIRITRVYDAPVSLVWNAWVDPEQVGQWWGPRGFTLTTKSKDVRPGGFWIYTMHGPDGVDYPNHTVFHEVEKNARLVYDHGANENQGPLFRVTVTFSERAGKTTIDMTMALANAEAAAQTKKFIKKAGGNATWDRLAEFLSGTDRFVINRSFHAPIETVFRMWTEPKHFSEWLPPTGMKMELLETDIRPGGSSFYRMYGSGFEMFGKIQYLEVSEPERIVYTQIFCDANGNRARHPFAPIWPETMRTTVTLAEEAPEETRVTVQWDIEGEATADERAAFRKERGGMTEGWSGSFDKLDELLGERK